MVHIHERRRVVIHRLQKFQTIDGKNGVLEWFLVCNPSLDTLVVAIYVIITIYIHRLKISILARYGIGDAWGTSCCPYIANTKGMGEVFAM